MWRSTAQPRSAHNTFSAPWTHLYFTFLPYPLLSSTNEGYHLALLRRTGHVALTVFFFPVGVPVPRCLGTVRLEVRCCSEVISHISARGLAGNTSNQAEALAGRCTQPLWILWGDRVSGGVGVGQWVGYVLLFIMFLLIDLIHAPSITSFAGEISTAASRTSFGLFYFHREGWGCGDLNTKAGRERIQEKVSLLNECWQPQTSGQFHSPLNGTDCHWAYNAAIATESQMRLWSKLEINWTLVKFIFENEVIRGVFAVQTICFFKQNAVLFTVLLFTLFTVLFTSVKMCHFPMEDDNKWYGTWICLDLGGKMLTKIK